MNELDRIVTAYLKLREQGKHPDRQKVLERYPHLAGQLREFFAGEDDLEKRTATLRHLQSDPSEETVALRSADERTPGVGAWPRIDDYQIEGEIARGGMGVVYRARQISLNRMVALKMVLAGELAGAQEKQRFQAEAEAAAALDHPHIVPIYHVGSHQGQPFFTMKLIDGVPLSKAIAELRGRQRVVARLMAKIARAVHFAHQRGLLHRDLKPGNILLDREGSPHVTDFGLAKKVEDDRGLTQTGAIVGTPSYMAPEQARAEKRLTTAADVYALGAILYDCLTGQPPFRGSSPLDTILQVLEKQPERPRALSPKVARDLETICLKCLEKEPARRYGSAESLAEDLDRWRTGEPIEARPVGTAERVLKWCLRRPAMAGLLAGVLAISMVATALVTWKWREARTRAITEAGLRREAEEAQQETEKARAREVEQRKAAEKARNSEAEQRAEAERSLYFSRVNLAHAEYERGNINRMEELLDSCPPRRIGWEWHFLKRLTSLDLATLPCHRWAGAWAVWSPDGRYLASSGTNWGTVQLWDAVTYRPVRSWEVVPRVYVLGGAFSPDSKLLAVACGDPAKPSTPGLVLVWKTATGEKVHEFQDHTACVACVAFSPDGTLLLSGSGSGGHDFSQPGELILRETATGKVRWKQVVPEGIREVAFHPNGKELVHWCRLRLRATSTGEILRATRAFPDSARSAGYSPEGTRLAVVDSGSRGVKVLDPVTGAVQSICRGHRDAVSGLAFGREGRLFTGSHDQAVRIHDASNGEEQGVLRGHRHWVIGCSPSPDGKRLASVSVDGQIKVWDLTASTDGSFTLPHPGGAVCLACSADNRWLATAGAGKVLLWNRQSWRVVRQLEAPTDHRASLAFSGNSGLLAVGCQDGNVRLWDVRTGRLLISHTAHENCVRSVSLDGPGKHLATAAEDGSAKVWRLNALARLTLVRVCRERQAGRSAVALSARGTFVAVWNGTSGESATLTIQDVATGRQSTSRSTSGHPTWGIAMGFTGESDREQLAWSDLDALCVQNRLLSGGWDVSQPPRLLLRGHTQGCHAVAVSPDGSRLATVDHATGLRLWDAGSGEPALTLHVPDLAGGYHASLSFSGDSRALVVRCAHGLVRVYDVPPAAMPFAREESGLWHLALSPDGSTLAAALKSGTVTLRDAASGKLLRTLTGAKGQVRRVAFSPDGRSVAAGTMYGPVHLWEAGALQVWDARTGKAKPGLTVDGLDGHVAAFSPDGKRLLTAGQGQGLQLRDASSRRLLRQGRPHGAWYAAWSPNAPRLATVGPDGKVRIWKADTLDLEHTLDGHPGGAPMAAFHPDGHLLATCGFDGWVIVWDSATWKPVKKLEVGGNVFAVAFSRDGKRLACGGDGRVLAWEVGSWKRVPLGRSRSTGRVDGVVFSRNGRELFSSDPNGVVKRWTLPASNR
jgi:WD40 repeat protein